jgi:hypothetical protein
MRLKSTKENADEEWDRILFTDECSLEFGATNRQQWVSRRSGERFDPNNVASNTISTRHTLMV